MLSKYFLIFFICVEITGGVLVENNCPSVCTCQLQHLTETSIYRFIQQDYANSSVKDANLADFNEVYYDSYDDKPIVRSAVCILQKENDPRALFESLVGIESLTLIQGYNTGAKHVKISDLKQLKKLISFELIASSSSPDLTSSNLTCTIDAALPELKYINFESVTIKNSINQVQNFLEKYSNAATPTFEFTQKAESLLHPVVLVQRAQNEEIVSYDQYKTKDNLHKVPLFVGFDSLNFLRIKNCDLSNLHWAMFRGLNNLETLILEKNGLRIVPPFSFYQVPNLKVLSLAHNKLLDIHITDLAGLLNLEYLDLTYNNFTQLSELSLPPFPNLKLADFSNNPITVIFPNTFEVLNTTDSLIIGSEDADLTLIGNSFVGLNLLQSLTLKNLRIPLLQRELFIGMPNLNELILTGNVTRIEYDTFIEMGKLKNLILKRCRIVYLSMDSFIGLEKLEILDLSLNELQYLIPGVFDPLTNIKELYLNGNKLSRVPNGVFSRLNAKLIRLNDNPWQCSCEMIDWKQSVMNRIKHKVINACKFAEDKGISCANERDTFVYKYMYESRIEPKCSRPKIYQHMSVFVFLRKKCAKVYARKMKKIKYATNYQSNHLKRNYFKKDYVKLKKNLKFEKRIKNLESNDINILL